MSEDYPTDDLTPDQIRQLHPPREGDTSLLAQLVTPESRAKILDALIGASGEPLTASEICDRAGIGTSTFDRHVDVLLEFGVVAEAGRGGPRNNAATYRADPGHPAVQVLTMLDHILRFGTTEVYLDSQFIGAPGADYEPGDHPADSRGE